MSIYRRTARCFFISLSLIIISVLLQLGSADAAIISVGTGDSIQSAIRASRPGDTIEVLGGIYYEHINVNKQLTLRGIGMPIMDATASGSAITLSADGVILQGFKTINAGLLHGDASSEAGIRITSSKNVVQDNYAVNSFNGIVILDGRNNTVANNTASNNLGCGIKLVNASYNLIFKNTLYGNYLHNAYDSDANQWDDDATGNYYSDFDSPDEGCMFLGEGLCNSSYPIPGGLSVDMHPLSHPWRSSDMNLRDK